VSRKYDIPTISMVTYKQLGTSALLERMHHLKYIGKDFI